VYSPCIFLKNCSCIGLSGYTQRCSDSEGILDWHSAFVQKCGNLNAFNDTGAKHRFSEKYGWLPFMYIVKFSDGWFCVGSKHEAPIICMYIPCILIVYYLFVPTNVYTGCPRRNVPDFGKVFLMLNYTDIIQNTYVQIWTVTEIMAREIWNFDSCYTFIDYQIHIKTGRNMWFL